MYHIIELQPFIYFRDDKEELKQWKSLFTVIIIAHLEINEINMLWILIGRETK